MGRKRWAGTTAKQRQEYARKLSVARLKKLSKEERSEIARAAVTARWEKWRAEHPESSHKAKPQTQGSRRKTVKARAKAGARGKAD